jgi:hypothetical protein
MKKIERERVRVGMWIIYVWHSGFSVSGPDVDVKTVIGGKVVIIDEYSVYFIFDEEYYFEEHCVALEKHVGRKSTARQWALSNGEIYVCDSKEEMENCIVGLIL